MLCLPAMKKQQTLENLNRLRLESDPRFREEVTAIADSLERLLEGASKGGRQRAKTLTKKRRSEIARNAANARWNK